MSGYLGSIGFGYPAALGAGRLLRRVADLAGQPGEPVPEPAQLLRDTINVGPGERYDVIWEAREPGQWLLHCHIPHHTTNDNVEERGGGGLMAVIAVTP